MLARIARFVMRIYRYRRREGFFLRYPIVSAAERKYIIERHDPIRDFSVALALKTIQEEKIPGNLAEIGVYQGATSVLIRKFCPDRDFYVFDTFGGFPQQDLTDKDDKRFADTSYEYVAALFRNDKKTFLKQGYFPETARGLEDKNFSFVMMDADLYAPTLAGLEFFYPRLSRGAYVFLHDYTSFESDRGVSRAFKHFMADKPEQIIHFPDEWGSAAFRKV